MNEDIKKSLKMALSNEHLLSICWGRRQGLKPPFDIKGVKVLEVLVKFQDYRGEKKAKKKKYTEYSLCFLAAIPANIHTILK